MGLAQCGKRRRIAAHRQQVVVGVKRVQFGGIGVGKHYVLSLVREQFGQM